MAEEKMSRENEFTCEFCGEEFTNREELQAHHRETHPEESRSATGRTGSTPESTPGRSGTTTGTPGQRTGRAQETTRSASPRRENR